MRISHNCPFCDAEPNHAVERNSFAGMAPHFVIICSNEDCPADLQVSGGTLDEVWKRWNTRGGRTPVEQEIDLRRDGCIVSATFLAGAGAMK